MEIDAKLGDGESGEMGVGGSVELSLNVGIQGGLSNRGSLRVLDALVERLGLSWRGLGVRAFDRF